jgi:hypothetical protein
MTSIQIEMRIEEMRIEEMQQGLEVLVLQLGQQERQPRRVAVCGSTDASTVVPEAMRIGRASIEEPSCASSAQAYTDR